MKIIVEGDKKVKKSRILIAIMCLTLTPSLSWGQTINLEDYFIDLREVLLRENIRFEKIDYRLDLFSELSFDTTNDKAYEILKFAFQELGKPYKFGETGPEYYDCSGYTFTIFSKVGINLPRTSFDQGNRGIFVERFELSKGDLVFFDTRSTSNINNITDTFDENDILDGLERPDIFVPEKITHVGIYIGNGEFIHASSSGTGVIVSSLNNRYYSTRFLHGRRYH